MNFFRSLTSLAAFAALLPGLLNAQSCACNPCACAPRPIYENNGCNPCDWDCSNCLGGLEIGVDYLYWKPFIDDLDFAATVTVEEEFDVPFEVLNKINYKSFCPDWESGIRGYIAFPVGCDWGIRISGLYIDFNQHKNISEQDAFIISPLFHPSLASNNEQFSDVSARWRNLYQEYDALMTYSFECGQSHQIAPFFGVAGIYTEQYLKAEFSNPESEFGIIADLKWDSSFWGVGLKVGSEYEFTVCNCLQFFAHGDGTILAGKADNRNSQSLTTFDGTGSVSRVKSFDPDCWHFVPGYHLAAGIAYEAELCGIGFSARVGYEFTGWFNMPNPRRFSGSGVSEFGEGGLSEPASTISHSSSWNDRMICYQGLFAGLGFRF